ncbi:tetratricopeptide repeat protein [Mesonia aquimarina]|uniref:tetratricopeptide repeat protein n=1 Tax=Mesonia aquimarina TaxID=1504967 RepID=UPI0013CF3B0E|nr:tetratricopeptide repeat protein [Mesonia aquimarina]
MKKNFFRFILMVILPLSSFSQSKIETYTKEGIQYHDKGSYDKAIESYEKALKIDPKSTLLNYEIALSYFSKGEYKRAIKHSDIVLKQGEDLLLQAYMTKGGITTLDRT